MQQEDCREGARRLEALGNFAGGIAHDFNNILSIIQGYAHIALKKSREGQLCEEHLEKIIKSSERGAALTRQLLAFSRQNISVEQVHSLGELVCQQKVLLKPSLGDSITMFIDCPKEPFYINCAPEHITQILLNMAINARDAMPLGGHFSISARPCEPQALPEILAGRAEKFVLLTVEDDGEGIDARVLPRIFDPFFTTKDEGRGTGLGLSVVYGLIQQMRGHIRVSSEKGRGALFEIFLPLSEPPLSGVSAGDPADTAELRGKTVLLAEDQSDLRDVLSSMLGGLDMNVLCASSGNHALAVQEEYAGRIDLLLTDIVMPSMNGVRLAELFRSLRPDTQVVYMSGYPFMESVRDYSIPENACFIPKPICQPDIERVLCRALAQE